MGSRRARIAEQLAKSSSGRSCVCALCGLFAALLAFCSFVLLPSTVEDIIGDKRKRLEADERSILEETARLQVLDAKPGKGVAVEFAKIISTNGARK